MMQEQAERWRIRCHPFGRTERQSVSQVLIQAVSAEGATVVAPGGGFRLTAAELRELAACSAEAMRAQQWHAAVVHTAADGRLGRARR